MDSKTKKQYRERIQEEIDTVTDVIESFDKNIENRPENYGEHRSTPTHLADAGTDTMENEKNTMLRLQKENYLNELKRSLEDLNQDKYGRCEVCGKEISPERLEALPTAKLCADDAVKAKE